MKKMKKWIVKPTGRWAVGWATALVLGLAGPELPASGQQVDPFKGAAPKKTPSANLISSVEFVDTPITTIFKMISDLTGWSVLMSPEVTKQPPRINIWIKNLPADEVLRQVVELAGLVANRQGETVTVMTYEEYCRQFGVDKTVLQLTSARAKDLAAILKPLVEKESQNRVIADERSNQIILLVPRPLLDSVQRLVRAMDMPLQDATDTIRLVPLAHADAETLLPQVQEFLTQAARGATPSPGQSPGRPTDVSLPTPQSAPAAPGTSSVQAGGAYNVRFMCEPRLNAIVLRGPESEVRAAAELLSCLDVASDIQTQGYVVHYGDPREVYEALAVLAADPNASPKGLSRLRMALCEQGARIVVIGSSRDHARVKTVLDAVDRQLPPGTGSIRIYRLENATAEEVAGVLQSLVSKEGQLGPAGRPARYEPLGPSVGGIRRVQPAPGPAGGADTGAGVVPAAPSAAPPGAEGQAETGSSAGELPPSIVAAPEINAVVVRAPATQQEELGKVIVELDRPRSQVMLEVTVVSVQSTGTFDLGIELAGAIVNGHGVQQISFTSFGIGAVDTTTGRLRLAAEAPTGLNVAIFNASDFSLVLNALKTVGKTRITSSPKILVEDNSEGLITQIDQEPFEVTEQGETTTVTSFGGYVDAGTILAVTPHLSQEDWLRLVYDITFSSFGSQSNPRLPPARLQNVIHGTARVPAEHVVVLGGLVNRRQSHTKRTVPLLGDIPVLGLLFTSVSDEDSDETLYVFIRPVILREPSFEDLVCLSHQDLARAGMPPAAIVNPLKDLPGGLEMEIAPGNQRETDEDQQ